MQWEGTTLCVWVILHRLYYCYYQHYKELRLMTFFVSRSLPALLGHHLSPQSKRLLPEPCKTQPTKMWEGKKQGPMERSTPTKGSPYRARCCWPAPEGPQWMRRSLQELHPAWQARPHLSFFLPRSLLEAGESLRTPCCAPSRRWCRMPLSWR